MFFTLLFPASNYSEGKNDRVNYNLPDQLYGQFIP